MTSELVVDVQPKEISIALLEDKALVEFQKEGRSASFNVGNMYLGRVKKLMPGLNACFVDVGFEKDAFLHYLDLGPQFHSYQKYLKQVLSDRKKLFPSQKLLCCLISKGRDGFNHPPARSGSYCADCKGTYLDQGAQTNLRIVIRRTLFGINPFQRQGFGITKN